MWEYIQLKTAAGINNWLPMFAKKPSILATQSWSPGNRWTYRVLGLPSFSWCFLEVDTCVWLVVRTKDTEDRTFQKVLVSIQGCLHLPSTVCAEVPARGTR